MPSLSAYLLLAQDEPKVWAWVRTPAGFSPGADVISGHGAVIEIAALHITLPLSEIYSGFEQT